MEPTTTVTKAVKEPYRSSAEENAKPDVNTTSQKPRLERYRFSIAGFFGSSSGWKTGTQNEGRPSREQDVLGKM